MKILKNGDAYFNLNVLDAFIFLDSYKSLIIGSGDNQREFKLHSSKHQEFKTKFHEFLLNSDSMMDISDYVIRH